MKKLVIANWKMLPTSLAEAQEILARMDDVLGELGENREMSLVVCPPFVFIEEVARTLGTGHLEHSAELGAQDIAIQESGALTGEVSGSQLAKLGVHYVIIGHSERRWKLGESDATVNEKLKVALRDGLIPIVCVGERTREGEWQAELSAQVQATFSGVSSDDLGRCLIAYEPVWAISTNPGARPDTPESAAQSVALLRDVLGQQRFLYGGSVTDKNARAFLERPEFSGVLVGGASVRAEEFTRILEISATI